MKILLIGVAAFTAVALLEALFYTLRFLSDRRRDELKRRLSNLGGGEPGACDVRAAARGEAGGEPRDRCGAAHR